MKAPPQWTEEELERERQLSIEAFRRSRLEEPLEDYLEHFEKFQGQAEDLLETTVDLGDLETRVLDFLGDTKLLTTFRYLAGPPISEDDLKTLTETTSLNRKRLAKEPELVRRIIETVLIGLDKRRFPWVEEGREASEEERRAAVLATAALMAMRRIETDRRGGEKKRQEERVDESLIEIGMERVKRRTVKTIAEAPASGAFCRESKLGSRKADFVVGLWDRRVMAIECKVSNSALNSVKRLNNDAAVKATVWMHDFGARQIVPTAVLSGVYELPRLLEAQERGLALFWAHDLRLLGEWIAATRS